MHEEAWIHFFRLLAESKDLREEFVAMAARHGIDFTAGSLPDEDLEAVVGGGGIDEQGLASLALHHTLKRQQMTAKALSAISRVMHDTEMGRPTGTE